MRSSFKTNQLTNIRWRLVLKLLNSPTCGLESKNDTSKIIPKVEKDNGEIVTDQKDILKEVQYFYENLYKNKDEDKGCSLKDIVEGLKGASIRKLTEEEKII